MPPRSTNLLAVMKAKPGRRDGVDHRVTDAFTFVPLIGMRTERAITPMLLARRPMGSRLVDGTEVGLASVIAGRYGLGDPETGRVGPAPALPRSSPRAARARDPRSSWGRISTASPL